MNMSNLMKWVCPHSVVTAPDDEQYAICTSCLTAVYVGPLRLADLEQAFQRIREGR